MSDLFIDLAIVDCVIIVLFNKTFGMIFERFNRFIAPPLMEVAVGIEFATEIVETMG